MKKIKILSMILLASLFMMSCSSDDDDNLNTAREKMEQIAKKHYPENKVIQTKEITYKGGKAFEIKLEGDIELKFDGNGDLIEVESKTRIPDSLIPTKILDFISKYYPDNYIIEWELEDDHQEVKLDNGVELEFEREGVSEVDISKLPSGIKEFLSNHFSDAKVVKYVKTTKLTKVTYKVELLGGIELKFNDKKEIVEIESKTKLPDSVIPSKILDYVAVNYPDNFIVEWEIEDDHQEVELDNGLELEFTMSGEFIKVDN